MTKFGSIFLTKSIHLYVDFCQKWPFLTLSHFIGRKRSRFDHFWSSQKSWHRSSNRDSKFPIRTQKSYPAARSVFARYRAARSRSTAQIFHIVYHTFSREKYISKKLRCKIMWKLILTMNHLKILGFKGFKLHTLRQEQHAIFSNR